MNERPPLSQFSSPSASPVSYTHLDVYKRQVYLWASAYANQRAVVSTREFSMILDERGTMVARVTLQCGIRTLYGSYNQRLWPLSMPQRCRQ